MPMYTTEEHYYEASNVDVVSASLHEVSGMYAPNDDGEALMRRFRVRLPRRLRVTGERIEAAIRAQEARARDHGGEA